MVKSVKQPRIVKLRENILEKNDLLARKLREKFVENNIYVVNMVSSPGTGKTTLLTEVLKRLNENYKAVALVGDLATANDAEKLESSGADVHQITTGTVCHLEAQMIDESLKHWDLPEIDFLFIENVGNLVCPADYDLGENEKVVLFSATEGEDKPEKYPPIVNSSDSAILTKTDLAEAAKFEKDKFYDAVYRSRPDMKIFEISVMEDDGIDEWINYLIEARQLLKTVNN